MPMKTDLVIFGTGGHAREVADAVLAARSNGAGWNLIGFLDQAKNIQSVCGYPVLGNESWLDRFSKVSVVVGIGNPRSRKKVVQRLQSMGYNRFATVVHPDSYIGRDCRVGSGAMIFAGAVLTCEVMIGDHAIVNVGSTLSHEVRLDEFATLAPQCAVCGAVTINEGADIGAKAAIIQGRTIGAWSVVGAGAVVINDIPPNVTAVGCPARVIKERPDGWQQE
jgi:sugar O-acyltransferase (sialic acid O-acetyltransferase NeuD family)